jgi:hypothetical protein
LASRAARFVAKWLSLIRLAKVNSRLSGDDRAGIAMKTDVRDKGAMVSRLGGHANRFSDAHAGRRLRQACH